MPKDVEGQIPLIDCEPENAKAIKRCARAYKRAQAARSLALAEEVKLKRKLLDVVKEADLKMVDGMYSFRLDGLVITVKPRDELVRVREDDEECGEDDE